MTQIEKLRIFREVLIRYNPKDFLNEEDFAKTIELFKNHPSWNIKNGIGIKQIEVIHDKWKKKGFILHRLDGTYTDISFVIASRGYDNSDLNRIKSACRNAVAPEILKEKDKIRWGVDICPITNEILSQQDTHIDHYDLTFEMLFNKWIKQFDIEILKKALNDNRQDNVVEDIFIDEDIKRDFIGFHNSNTHLRAVSKKANLSLLRRREK